MTAEKIGIVILAAGGSTRYGSPKQLLKFEGKSLLRRAADTAVSSGCSPVVVVLGSNSVELLREVGGLPVEIVINSDWHNGVSASIKTGLSKLLAVEPSLSAVIFMLCDQPFVNVDTISRLIGVYRSTKKPIVASEYEDTLGVPALFDCKIFVELADLKGDSGAKRLIQNHPDDVFGIPVPEAAIDIDRVDDYEKLTSTAS